MPEVVSIADRRLNAARLVGATIIAVVAQLAVDMPEGYFGPADDMTATGGIYVALLIMTTVTCVTGLLKGQGWASKLVPLILSLNIGVFVAPLAASPVIAGITIVWNLVILSLFVFPWRTMQHSFRARMRRKPRGDELEQWLALNGAAVGNLLFVSIFLNIAVVGFELSGQLLAQSLTLGFSLITTGLTLPLLWGLVKRGRRLVVVFLLPVLVSVLYLGSPEALLLLLGLYMTAIFLLLLSQGALFHDVLEFFYEQPALLLLATFAALSLLGTLFLSFPAASATGVPVSPLDAFFTATSAACITGLIVLDTPTDFSTFGHVVILILIQLGGIGIVVLSTFATLLLGSKLGLRAERALEEVLDLRGAKNAYRLTMFIVAATLLIEGIGAILLSIAYYSHGYALGSAVWHGVFHAISAFCHAGFALQSDSIMMFEQDPFALTVFSVLITLGSVGFLVLAGLWQRVRGESKRFNLHVKVILVASLVFLVLGILLFALCEWNGVLAEMSVGHKWMNALMQSVTLRSAGFNSVDSSVFAPATILFMLFFMFVGGAPGSAAGGIKVTTFIVLLFAIRGIAAGEPRVVIFNRRISQNLVYRSAAIVIITMLIALVLFFVLLLTQPLPFEILAFEAISAVGTVGLSMGATPDLNAIGKFIIILVIFIGRIGPLALALTLGRAKPGRLDYPEAKLMVG
ncbi:MAG: TrkH family potassium uptake protein [Bradymonadaceae bacterium]